MQGGGRVGHAEVVWVGHTGVGWVMQGWGGSYSGGADHAGVQWIIQG